jgi:E3 ubiquitin-protein ligase RNF115/126
MQPDPHCASCNGTFVEKIENPQDDPREFDRIDHDFGEDMPGIPPILMGLLSGMNVPLSSDSRGGTRSAPGSPPIGGSGFRFEMTSGSGPSARTYILGGPNRLGRPEPLDRSGSFMRRADQPPEPGTAHDISGPMMAQYLMALLGAPGGRGEFGNIFGGPESGRWGDYAFSQEALDRIVTELMENSNAHRPVAATEEVMDKLPRDVLEAGSPLLEKDCAVCKEQFALNTEDPDEQVVVTLPCKHPFHQPCIIPWLKTSATCPVCRYALVPQPDQHGPPGQTSQPAGTSGGNMASEQWPPQQPPSSPPANTGSSGLLGSLLGMMLPGHSSGSNTWGSNSDNNSQGNGGSSSSDRNPNLPGGWRES